jgi:hypothetical protein
MLAATGVGATLPTPEIAALSFVPQASMQGAYDLWLSRLEAARL